MPDAILVLVLALAYQLSWLLARRRGFTGVTVLVGWLALAAAWMALSHGPVAALAAGLAATAIFALRDRWLHYFERPGIHCRELGGRLHLAGLGYGAFLTLDVPGVQRTRHAIWIDGVDGDALGIRRLLAIRRLLEGAGRVRFGELRQQSGHLVARVYADGRDIAALLAEGEPEPLPVRRRSAPRRRSGPGRRSGRRSRAWR